jgi:hypothetical protein
VENQFPGNCYTHTNAIPGSFKIIACFTFKLYTRTTTPCAATTRHPAAQALPQPCRVLRLLASGRNNSTSTTLCAASTRLLATTTLHKLRRAPRVLVSRSHRLYINYVMRLVVDCFVYAARLSASATRAAHRRLLCLHRASECLGSSCGSSSTTSPMPCVSHWLDLDYSPALH